MYCLHKYGKELNCVLHQTYQSCSMRRIYKEFKEKYKNLFIALYISRFILLPDNENFPEMRCNKKTSDSNKQLTCAMQHIITKLNLLASLVIFV